eukprot:1083537-Rhodomonas_salina.2
MLLSRSSGFTLLPPTCAPCLTPQYSDYYSYPCSGGGIAVKCICTGSGRSGKGISPDFLPERLVDFSINILVPEILHRKHPS